MTDVEKDLLRDTERLAHLAYASEHYRIAEAAMGQGLVEEADIAAMQGRLANLRAEKVVMKEAGATEALGIVPELYDAGRTDLDLFQEALRKFNAARVRDLGKGKIGDRKDLFGNMLTQQTAAQWGPNTASEAWSTGWSAPLQAEDQAPLFSMLNASFKTTSTVGEFSKYLRWYDKFLNYWKARPCPHRASFSVTVWGVPGCRMRSV